MSENSGRNDPSMKEILGSIRRIINEDNAQSAAAGNTPDEEEILDLTEEVDAEEEHRPRLDPSFGAAQAKAEEPEVRREPVLGLHSPVRPAEQYEPEPTEEEIPAATAGEAPAATGEYSEAEYVADAQPDVPRQEIPSVAAGRETAETSSEPAPAAVEMTHEQPGAQSHAPAMEEEPMPVEEANSSSPEQTVSEPEAPEVAPPVEPVREIVSESTTAATATVIGELTRAMEEQTNKLKLGPGEETISDMVREMLRPMLREWLDENLPGIVERIVRREIQKLVDRAEADD